METEITGVLHSLGLDKWIPLALAFHALASTIDASLPQPAPGSHWLPFRKLVSILALNFGNAGDSKQPRIVTWLQRIVILLASFVPPPPEPGSGSPTWLQRLVMALAAVVPPPPEPGTRVTRVYPKEPAQIIPEPAAEPDIRPAFIPPAIGTPQ